MECDWLAKSFQKDFAKQSHSVLPSLSWATFLHRMWLFDKKLSKGFWETITFHAKKNTVSRNVIVWAKTFKSFLPNNHIPCRFYVLLCIDYYMQCRSSLSCITCLMYQMCLYVARDPPVSVIDIELDKTKQNHTDIHIMHEKPNVVFFCCGRVHVHIIYSFHRHRSPNWIEFCRPSTWTTCPSKKRRSLNKSFTSGS